MLQALRQLRASESSRLAPTQPLPTSSEIRERASRFRQDGLVPLIIAELAYDALPVGAADQFTDASDLAAAAKTRSFFAAAPYAVQQPGPEVTFVVDASLVFGSRARAFDVDFGDGQGYRRVAVGSKVQVRYASEGEVVVSVRTPKAEAEATMEVIAFGRTTPNQTLSNRRGTRPYAGVYGYYDAQVFYGNGNSRIRKPIVIVEGFDPYGMNPYHPKRFSFAQFQVFVSQQGFRQRLQDAGYDIVLVRFRNPTTYIQSNAFAVEALLNWLRPQLAPGEETILLGPSMGGLVTRYATAYMEHRGFPTAVSLLASLDTPHGGANIPVADQFFFDFFASQAVSAEEGKRAVDSPAARQMLVYHYDSHSGSSLGADPLRTTFVNELTTYGFPSSSRNVAVANGSGTSRAQNGTSRVQYRTMNPGDLMVYSRERRLAVDWDVYINALRDGSYGRAFYGRLDIFGPHYRSQSVYVRDAIPVDGAPGGYRPTHVEIVDGLAGEGADVAYANFEKHAFIPTVSALDLPTSDVFYSVSSDPLDFLTSNGDGSYRTAIFDAVYYPTYNQAHVAITSANRDFLFRQIDPSLIVPPNPPLSISMQQVSGGQAGQRLNYRATVLNAPAGTNTFRWYTGSDELGPWTLQNTLSTTSTSATYISFPQESFGLRVTVTNGSRTGEAVRWVFIGGGGGGGGDCDEILCPGPGEPLAGGEDGIGLGNGSAVTMALPEVLALDTPFPNPTPGRTALDVALPEASSVTLTVHDLLGREVARPMDATYEAGTHRAVLDLTSLPSGVYLCRLSAGAQVLTQRVTVAR